MRVTINRNNGGNNNTTPTDGRGGVGWNLVRNTWISRRGGVDGSRDNVNSSAVASSIKSNSGDKWASIASSIKSSTNSTTGGTTRARRDTAETYGMMTRGTNYTNGKHDGNSSRHGRYDEQRLHQITVFEIKEDGTTEYSTMTLRALYNYVVSSITDTCKQAKDERKLITRIRNSANSQRQGLGEKSVNFRGVNFSLKDINEGDDETSNRGSTKSVNSSTSSAAPKRGLLKGASMSILNKKERLGGYLHPRDMRRLITPFSSSNEPQLLIRRHVMLLNFDPLRAIVLKDKLLVLVPPVEGAETITTAVERRVRGGIFELENQVFGSYQVEDGAEPPSAKNKSPKTANTGGGGGFLSKKNSSVEEFAKALDIVLDNEGNIVSNNKDSETADETTDTSSDHDSNEEEEWDDLQKESWKQMPFELQSVDAVLQTVVSLLMDDAKQVAGRSVVTMRDLRSSGLSEHAQERLRIHKDEVQQMEGRVNGFVRAVNTVLDDDVDMTLMNLSRLLTHPERFVQPVAKEVLHEESDGPELILEAYLQQSLSIVNGLDLLKGQILATEEQISMTLDAIRNRLLYINTLLSVASLCVSVGSFIGSIFGMNLKIPTDLMEDDTAFVETTIGTCVGMTALWALLSYAFYRAANIKQLGGRESIMLQKEVF